MLRPRFLSSLVKRTGYLVPVCAVYSRFCSTLGDIQVFMTNLRAREKLAGGSLQLCITEDMQVFAEHKTSSFSGEQRRILTSEKLRHGDASTTIAEVLRSLQSTESAATALSSVPTSSPSSSSFNGDRSALTTCATVVDLGRVTADEVRSLVLHVERTYPTLKLLVLHTSGRDLQGAKLHTICVELVPREGQTGAALLAEDTQRLVDTFKGESVGEGYHGCLRRALRHAFAAAELPYPSLSCEDATSRTLLSLYAQTWVNDGFQLFFNSVSPSALLTDAVECTVRHPLHGQTLGTTTLPLTAIGLRDLLNFCDRVAASYKPERYASVQQRIQSTPLHLVLPTSHLRVKHLLRKLLYHHYGCVDSDIIFSGHARHDGVFTAEIAVRLSSLSVTYEGAMRTPLFVLAKTNGTSRRKVIELAAVQSMQVLFPEVFEKQIAYHAEIRQIQQSDKASSTADMPPHVSRGLEVQLKWALQRINADFVVESVLLKQKTPYPPWGVTTGSSVVWLSQLFLLKQSSSSVTAGGTAPDVARELCAHAFDNRKSRCEKKVVAAALAKCFPDLCSAIIKDAQEKGLIDNSGAPTAFDGVQPIQDSDAERFVEALSSDPCLMTLVPTRSSVLQPLPECNVQLSALESYWSIITSKVTEQLKIRVQRGGDDRAAGCGGGYTATCVAGSAEGANAVDRVVCEAAASTEIGALFSMAEAAQKSLRQVEGTTSSGDERKKLEGRDAEGADHGPTSTLELLVGVPTSLPTSTPLQTCIDAIGRLYGLRCAVRITQEGAQYTGELWGHFPVDSALLRHHDRVLSSPFFLDRNFLLGRGRAESPFMAVVRAAQSVFECHVRVHQRAFRDAVVQKGKLHLHPADDCSLSRLRDAVVSEIKATSSKVLTDSTLTLNFQHGQLYELTFSVASGSHSVNLEETVSRNLLGCLHEFCVRVSAETGLEFLSATTLAPVVFHTPEQLLRLLCQLAYGLDLRVETLLVHNSWHCRLSIPVTGELACCVAESSAGRKKGAENAAAMAALKLYFADELTLIPSYTNFSPSRSSDGAAESEHTSMENYVFQMRDVDEDASPSL
ncbi:hypothetical protein ABL78_1615 [Leptomonas seymouri]|uniref:DRBM domain-containing protein n=1 Tax=Leptomonas seymouri TaxID=5684 RepID=A0A0N1IM25_LEPSE|nr:hypothetical protein ABL78_1615 [Leptomonas seymouri]|eukprot:KPI89282.1 hypothetical protein ABL78_1615 [Leptomonas seymouri]